MSHAADAFPTQTPNTSPLGWFDNPLARKWINATVATASVLVTVAWISDAAIDAFDISAYVDPAIKILLGVSGLFGIAVTTPNVPGGFLPTSPRGGN